MGNRYRAYIKPFNSVGAYATDYIDISDDVDLSSISSITKALDNTDYDVGVTRNSNFSIKLNNNSGRYSDIDNPSSIFQYRRGGSLFKLTWEAGQQRPQCGFAVCGTAYNTLSEPIDLFVGLINDDSLKQNLDDQKVNLTVLGRESLFAQTLVNFSALSDGMTISTIIYTILNQAPITPTLTVSLGSISLTVNSVVDSVASLENKTVQEALSKLLLSSNSVLSIEGDTVVVSGRQATTDIKGRFYGQGSVEGPENVQNISEISTGLNKVFNVWTWKNASVSSIDTLSIQQLNVRKKEVDFEFITNNTTRAAILQSLRDEFSTAMQEFSLTVPINEPNLLLTLKDRVTLDAPPVVAQEENQPVWGQVIIDTTYIPESLSNFDVSSTENYKILERSVMPSSDMIKFKVRKI